jgi:hypothetical protein
MKINIKYLNISLLFGIFLFQSCEKLPFDYRTKYIGEWSFRYEIHEHVTSGPGMGYYDYVYNYDGEIKYGPKFDEILIQFNNYEKILQLNKYGEFGPTEVYNNSTNFSSYSGKFEGRKKFFYTEYWLIRMKYEQTTIKIFGEKK